MAAGHIIALSFISLIFIFGEMSAGAGMGLVCFTCLYGFMTFLELLVAFLQAYVFLTFSFFILVLLLKNIITMYRTSMIKSWEALII